MNGARAVHGEWIKAWTLRSTVWTALLSAPLAVGVAVLVGLSGSVQPGDTVVGGALTGAPLVQIVAGIAGVLLISGEYGSGMIRQTFTVLPARATVLGAKALVGFGAVLAVSLVGVTGAYYAGAALLSGKGHADGDPWPALLGVALCVALTAVLGVAVGALVRHPAGSITATIALLLLPSLVGPLLGDLELWVTGALPSTVLQKLSQTSDIPSGGLGAWPSLALMAGYTAAVFGVAALRVRRRDT